MTTKPKLLNKREAGELLGRSERAVDRLRATDPTFPVPLDVGGRGRSLRFVEAELLDWLATRRVASTIA